MADCTEKKFIQYLAAYEMGLLEKEELEQLEQHLLVCDDCLNEIRQFHDVAGHILNSPGIRKIVERPAGSSKKAVSSRQKSYWVIIPVAVIALVFLILQPWKIDITPMKAVAEENRLMILCFKDLSGRQEGANLGEVVGNLLMTDLAESYYVEIVPQHQLQALMKSAGITDICNIDNATMIDFASRTKARWALQGAIIHEGGRIGLTSELIDASSGQTVATQQAVGEKDDDIFILVDRLTVEIKKDIALPEAAYKEPDRMVAEITTTSPEAYQHYLEGVRFYYMLYYDSALGAFEKAIVFDSTFAMAYYYLSGLKVGKYFEKAVMYSDNASWREKRYISSQQAAMKDDIDGAIAELNQIVDRYPYESMAYFNLSMMHQKKNDNDKAIEYLKAAIDADPYYKVAYNNLAFVYEMNADYENAIVAINKYVEIAPEEANPYDSRGLIYANNGKIDEAIISFNMALEKNPEFYESLKMLGILYSFKREYEKADSLFERIILTRDSKYQRWTRLYQAVLLCRQGKLDSSLVILDRLVTHGEIEKASDRFMGDVHLARALIYRVKGQINLALQEMAKILNNYDSSSSSYPYGFRHLYVQMLAENGETKTADSILNELQALLDSNPKAKYCYWYARGGMEFARANYTAAEEAFTTVAEICSTSYCYGYFEAHSMLALTCLKQQKIEEAVERFELLSIPYNYIRAYWSLWDVQSHYYLGIAYEKSNWPKKAAAEYQTFLDFWQNADPDLTEVDDARRRLRRIESTS